MPMSDPWFSSVFELRQLQFALSSGRRVRVMSFRCSGTYDFLLDGMPGPWINNMLIESKINEARLGEWNKVHLLPPATREGEDGGIFLPPHCCAAHLFSERMNNQSDESMVSVVWFTPPFFD